MSLFWIYLDCMRPVSNFELKWNAINKNSAVINGKAIRGNTFPFLRLYCCFCLHPSDFIFPPKYTFWLWQVLLFKLLFYFKSSKQKTSLPWWNIRHDISKWSSGLLVSLCYGNWQDHNRNAKWVMNLGFGHCLYVVKMWTWYVCGL